MQEQIKIVFILAHPDDESFIPSGTIARYAREGAKIVYLCATSGEGGRFIGTKDQLPPDELKMIRCQELESACQILGVAEHFVLDYPDGLLSTLDSIEPIRRLVAYLRKERPQIVITFDQTGISKHTDHRVIHTWVTQAFHHASDIEYEAFGEKPYSPAKLYYLTVPSHHLISISDSHLMERYSDSKITTVINVGKYLDLKRKAIECHRSQCYTIQRIFKFAGGMDEIDDHEYFILARCNIPDYAYEVVENDLLAGVAKGVEVEH